MFLPSFGPEVLISQESIDHGLWGLQWLRPTALFGIQGLDPVVHAVLWSILLNSFRLCGRLYLIQTVSFGAGASGAIYQRF